MSTPQRPHERLVTIIAQDPSVRIDGKVARARIAIPVEELKPGPVGYRVDVIDYDATTDTLYLPRKAPMFDDCDDALLLEEPEFHRCNAYALVMKTLARFEFALGRRIEWGFDGHQIKIAPHAFAVANAFYSKNERALLFGYFPGREGKMVFTCLSHDVVVHETTHALIDGLRVRYTEPSSPDQAAFHEGFADVVALLSVFSLPVVAAIMIDAATAGEIRTEGDLTVIPVEKLTPEWLRQSMLFSLAEEVGSEVQTVRGEPLRQSLKLTPSPEYLQQEEFFEPHRRGEVLVAAMLTAFIDMWVARLRALVRDRSVKVVDRTRAIEEGADIADVLLTSAIRALDYSPPVDISFSDYLSALLTSDREVRPSDQRYDLRGAVRRAFAAYGIKSESPDPDGYWTAAPPELEYGRTHFEPMQRDADEVFHFVWENRGPLKLHEEAYTRVESVRPCVRVAPDGFILRETVCEYVQQLELFASELGELGIDKPKAMPDSQRLKLFGGGALIFDEYGRLKFHVRNPINRKQQTRRLKYLWEYGYFTGRAANQLRFATLHNRRAAGAAGSYKEEW